MAKFTKKPVEIDAFQWTGDFQALDQWMESLGYGSSDEPQDGAGDPPMWLKDGDPSTLLIGTLEGDMVSPSGWWIIRGVEGEFYSCKPSVFDATYTTPDQAVRYALGYR